MQSCKIKSVKCMQSKKKIKKYACLVNQAAVHKSQTNLKTFSFQRLVLIALAEAHIQDTQEARECQAEASQTQPSACGIHLFIYIYTHIPLPAWSTPPCSPACA